MLSLRSTTCYPLLITLQLLGDFMSCKSSDQRDQNVGLSWQRRELADRAHSFQFTDDKNRGTQAESDVLKR